MRPADGARVELGPGVVAVLEAQSDQVRLPASPVLDDFSPQHQPHPRLPTLRSSY